MPSYLITGASRGIGLEFANHLSAKSDNVVFGLVRSKQNSPKLVALAEERKNLHIVEADITDIAALKLGAEYISKVTGGSLDVLINNAAYVTPNTEIVKTLTDFDPQALVDGLQNQFLINCTAQVLVTNIFLPLIKKGTQKKVIMISSGLADIDFTNTTELAYHTLYSISKSALTMVTVKYAHEFKEEGIIFLALSPGLVNTAERPPTEEELKNFIPMVQKFQIAEPELKGPMPAEQSVNMQMEIINNLTITDSGKFISHKGNSKQWL